MMMSSSSAEAGKIGGRTTMFNKTCDRLREYLKEKRALEKALPSSSTRKTMNLFPMEKESRALPTVVHFENNVVEEVCDHMVKDMTIFYNGRVILVENVSCDKANEIMRVATDLSLSSATVPNNSVRSDLDQFPQAIARDLSQTRSSSLTRFLEKRKERITARAPYTLKDKSWLGLSASPGN